jgi:hypothetical protein
MPLGLQLTAFESSRPQSYPWFRTPFCDEGHPGGAQRNPCNTAPDLPGLVPVLGVQLQAWELLRWVRRALTPATGLV